MNGRKLGAFGWNVLRSSAVGAVMLMGTGCDITNDPSRPDEYVCECVCDFGEPTTLPDEVCAIDLDAAKLLCNADCGEVGCLFGRAYLDLPPYDSCTPGGGGGIGGSGFSGGVPNSNDASLTHPASTAVITYADDPPIMIHVAGEASFTGGCEPSVGPSITSTSCPSPIIFNRILVLPDNFSIPTPAGTFNVTDAVVVNYGLQAGTQSGRGFTIPSADVQMLVNGDIDGVLQSFLFTPTPGEDLSGIHVPSTGQFSLFGNFTQADGDLTLSLNLNGLMTARPPVADAGASQIVSCNPLTGTGTALLDGSASTDIDGNLDTVAWYEGDTSLGTGLTLSAQFGVGTHTVTGKAMDTTGKFNAADTTVTVLHDAPPVFNTPASITVPTCTPGLVFLATPPVTDLCSATSPSVTGEIVEINGVVLVDPIPVDTVTGAVALPSGTAVIVWTASTDGGTATFEQTIEISDSADASCCGPTQVLYEGTAAADSKLDPNATTGYCMFGYGANDRLQSGAYADFISGGSGDDRLTSQGGDDVIVGGDGDDDITYNGNGTVVIGGGDGNDRIHLAFGPTSIILAGAGDDQVTCDGGNDTIYPGAGRDAIRAGSGDDTVIFRNVCELDSNKLLNGGAGDDTLILPVPLASLNGVTAIGFEHIVVDASQAHLAECP